MSTPGFVPLAEGIIDALLASEPNLAGWLGDHRYDDRLPDLSAAAVAERVTMLRDASGALSGVETDDLDRAERVDHEQLLSLVERRLFSLTEIREHEWNPLAHNPGGLLYDLMARPFAPLPQRLESLALRLDAVPDAMATARAVLHDCPRIHLETAVGQFRGAAGMLRDQLPPLLEQAPELAGSVRPPAAAAMSALEEFADWAAAAVSAMTGSGGRDPRLGRRLWEAKLW